ncbi:MAG: NlpC/P60 family protein [Rhizobiaceae bacterium]
MPTFDPRLHAYRDDLADIALKDSVSADRYVPGVPARVVSHFTDVYKRPDKTSMLQTQILHGHDVQVFDQQDDWAWIQNSLDGYVGYVQNNTLGYLDREQAPEPTHMVIAPRTFLYSGPDLKKARVGYRSMGSRVSVAGSASTRGTDYSILSSGEAVISRHLIDIGDWRSDPVSVAETLLHTPYLWGGNTAFGVDCSGLVSLSHMLCGSHVSRDSDMQAASIGKEIAMDFDQLERGDLVFWNGHVGMMADGKNLLHANGNTMNVALEPLADAIERISFLYDKPTLVRRP